MFSIYNHQRFESFTQLISQGFSARTTQAVIDLIYEYLPKIFDGDIFIFLPDLLRHGAVELKTPQFTEFTDEEKHAISNIKEYYQSGEGTYPVVIDGWYVTPVNVKSEMIFLLAADAKSMEKLKIDDEQRENVLSVVASLIYRIDALEDEAEKNIKFEKEKLRTQILSSISHDLKTPLAAIIGALNLITSMNTKISEEQKHELIEAAISEAHRLNNFITNILNMARIESGIVRPKMEWQNVEDVVKHIHKRFKLKYPNRTLKIKEIPGYLSVNMDAALFEQMMFNMLDNAVKYSPEETEIELDIEKNTSLDFIIIDHGKAVPEDMMEKIFDKYARLQIEDRKVAGTGLGLAIAKSLADLQNATITAARHPEGGMMMITSCPEWKI